MTTAHICIMAAIIVYLGAMIFVGYLCSKNNNDSSDFYLGGRKLGPLVTAMSAEASDMSSWLLMGLPGLAYLTGIADAGWTAIGLAIGTYVNWRIVAKRIRRYTHVAGNSITLPSFFSNRYRDEKKILQSIGAIFIVIFFIPYTASGFAACGKLFASLFGVKYLPAMIISALVIVGYTTLGGFLAASTTDFIQSIIMSIALVIVFVFGISTAGGIEAVADHARSLPGYLTMFTTYDPTTGTEQAYPLLNIISMLAWGLGYCGMPHILTRFMAVKSEKELKKSSAIAIVWDILSLTAACFIGIIGRAYLLPTVLGENGASSSESVFIEMINKLFSSHLGLPFIGGIFLCGILAAIMSTADSQLLVTASAASEDLYHQFIKKDADSKEILAVARFTVIVVSVLAFVIAWNPNSSIMGLVSNAWAGLGAAFGPTVVMSLFWRRTNLAGAVAGIVSGGLTVIVWDYIPFAAGQTLGSYTGLYSLAVGFAVSLVMIIIFSLATKAPSKEITDVFDKVTGK